MARHSKYSGEDLRAIRKRKGVGRPPEAMLQRHEDGKIDLPALIMAGNALVVRALYRFQNASGR